MCKKIWIIMTVLFLQSNLTVAQKIIRSKYPTPVLVTGLTKCGNGYWSIGGAGVGAIGDLMAAVHNPAGMQFEKHTLYAEFGKWSVSDWVENAQINGQTVIPSLVSIGKPIRKSNISLGYINSYNLSYKTSRNAMTIDGMSELTTEMNVKLHTYFGSIQFDPHDKISVGLTFCLNYLSHHERIFHSKYRGTGWGYSLIAGITIQPCDRFSFGCDYQYVSNVEYDFKYESHSGQIAHQHDDPTVWGNNPEVPPSFQSNSWKFIGKFPNIFETGLSYQLSEWWALNFGIEIQQWRFLYAENEDIVNYHIGSQISFFTPVKFAFGFFTQDYPNANYQIDQKFLTVGVDIGICKSMSVSAAILDSHLFKQKTQENNELQSYYSAGLSVKL